MRRSVSKEAQPGFLRRSLRTARGSASPETENGTPVELRIGLPATWSCGSGEGDFVALSIDHCVALGTSDAFVSGWILETDGQVADLTLSYRPGEGLDPRFEGEAVTRLDVFNGFADKLTATGGPEIGPEVGFACFVPVLEGDGAGPLILTCAGAFGTRFFSIEAGSSPEEIKAVSSAHGEVVCGRLAAAASADLDEAWQALRPRDATGAAAESRPGAGSTASRSRIKATIIDSDESRAIVAGDAELELREPVGWRFASGGDEFAALSIEHCIRVADDGVLVTGWFIRSGADQGTLALNWAEGPPVDPRSDPAWAKARADVVGGFAARLGTREDLPDPDTVGFQLFVPGSAAAATEPRLEITCETPRGVSTLRAAAEDSTERIAALVLDEWTFVKREMAHRLRQELGKPWWTALAHVSPLLTDADRLELSIDHSIAIPESGPVIAGWQVNGTGEETRIWLCTPGGGVEDLAERMICVFRHDIHELRRDQYDLRNLELGFIAHAANLEVDEGELVHVLVATPSEILGRAEIGSPRSSSVPMRDVEALLSLVGPSHPELRRVMDTVGPAISRVWANRPRPDKQIEIHDFGPVPNEPRLSIIVPIYGRWDFIEYQLALFTGDPEMREHELLYMIDDPRIFEAVLLYVRNIQPMFDVPIRVLYGHDNFGFAGANNAGASVARGELLLLLNSDVVPKEPGWSGRLLDTFARLDDAGLAGVRLLYHDGSLQHAGMRFQRSPALGGMWGNIHPCKGQPADTDPAEGPTKVDCVTAACMLIPADLYREVGGFDEDFIRGDFEDSDLCLKVARTGRHIYYLPGIELFHLERQSQELDDQNAMRAKITLYNCWQQTSRWDETIERLAAGDRDG